MSHVQNGLCLIQAGVIYAEKQARNAEMPYLHALRSACRPRCIHDVGKVLSLRRAWREVLYWLLLESCIRSIQANHCRDAITTLQLACVRSTLHFSLSDRRW